MGYAVLTLVAVLLPGYNRIIIICYVTVPVTTVTITPADDNNVVDIIEGQIHTFSCTTNYKTAGRIESVVHVHVNVCLSSSIISTTLLSPAGVIFIVV
jgi:hypothetical protein